MRQLIYALFFWTCLCGHLLAATAQYENQLIERVTITVEGAEATQEYMKKSIHARIKTREGSFFSQSTFDQDLKLLVQEFDHIDPTLQSVDGKMHITLRIWSKPTIRCIHWQGNSKMDSSDLQAELGITAYSIFDRHSFNQAFHKLKGYYIKKGYFEAELTYDIALDEESNEVEITICINEGRAGRIRKIQFCGFTQKEENDLLDMMITKQYNFFTSWLTNEGTYNEEAAQQDQFIILNYLQNGGYADARVALEVCEANENNRINIVITAEKGDRYTFGTLTFEGNDTFSNAEIVKQFRIREGDGFSPEKIRQTIENISKMYGRRGYIDAYVDYEPKLEYDYRRYSVHFKIDEGARYCVGLIKVFGNCSTQTRVILNETLLIPGEYFNQDKLKLTEIRLQNIGYFKHVNVYAVRTDEATSCLGDNYRDVHIEVEECGTGSLGAFAGFSTSENLFGGTNLTERNFHIAGVSQLPTMGLGALRGGGEYFHLNTTIGLKSRKYAMSWTKPHFCDSRWSVGFDLENSCNRYISKGYDIQSWGFTPHATYDYNAYVRVGWHYRLSHPHTKVLNNTGAKPDGQQKENANNADTPLGEQEKENINNADTTLDEQEKQNINNAKTKADEQQKKNNVVSALGMSINYDCTDSILRPTSGYRSRFEGEYAGLGGNNYFFAFAYLNSYYMKAGQRGVIKLRCDFRFIVPVGSTCFDTIPLNERIFLGGDNEVRGYSPYRLGKKFEDEPTGGISMQLYSIEYQRRIFERLDGFIYVDAGALKTVNWTFGSPFTAAGFGIKLQVFENAPPLTIGYGFPINTDEKKDVKRFFMTVGARF